MNIQIIFIIECFSYENLGDLNESNDEIISIPVKTFNFDTGTSAQEKTQIPASKFVDATRFHDFDKKMY